MLITRHPRPGSLARQRGISLMMSMIVLVALTLAGIALMRSVDTTTIIAGNLAFQQAATNSGDTGIETAIAASVIFDMPVWAATNSTMLAKWKPPAIAKKIVIFGDNDASFTGQHKAYELANRLAVRAKLDVDVSIPPDVGQDWADVLRKAKPRR